MRAADKQHRALAGDVESSSWSDLPEEDVYDHPPEEQDEIICGQIRLGAWSERGADRKTCDLCARAAAV